MEIEIPDPASVHQAQQPLAPTGFLADSEEGGAIVSGAVESVADDGVVALRVGDDVILLELTEDSLVPGLGQVVSLSVARIELYPYGF
ncbi:hypothetical protein [Actinacidiphila bryophytorum]|uniref:Uncharacterized protein n=1 Tax=Actinacidiphila bryophytorum TaxID=1436133 RepID=A0A9W4H4A3_9ACTN|nr:hypothetical protein [Actinacidiphila bryophytorum]MBM9435900.1 hypothetical protein [Actinacidiphila bryophytorum]MBN6544137.1 hypothetical protein [Actinacidiphila bryophytorum]CAG7649656.1 conserved hypothetical protein [Actinacidiphila bryophytorum]